MVAQSNSYTEEFTARAAIYTATTVQNIHRQVDEIAEHSSEQTLTLESLAGDFSDFKSKVVRKEHLLVLENGLSDKLNAIQLELTTNLLKLSENINELQREIGVYVLKQQELVPILSDIPILKSELKNIESSVSGIKNDIGKVISERIWYKTAAGFVIAASTAVISLISFLWFYASDIAGLQEVLRELINKSK